MNVIAMCTLRKCTRRQSTPKWQPNASTITCAQLFNEAAILNVLFQAREQAMRR
jgi:hypothetical protein